MPIGYRLSDLPSGIAPPINDTKGDDVEKIWLNNYPQGMPAEIDTEKYQTINDIFHRSVERFSTCPAYSNLGKTMTFAELEQKSRAFAAYLQADAGLHPGDRIALMMPNLLQYPVALFGALRAGLIVVNVNPLYTDRELSHQLRDSGAVAIVILENFAHTLEAVLDETLVTEVITTRVGDLAGFPKSALVNFVIKRVKKMVPPFSLPFNTNFNTVLKKGKDLDFHEAELEARDTAFLQYTGGTTGIAKGAELTHGNMVANMLQAGAWASADLQEGKEVFIAALPMYHIFALTANVLFGLELGARNVLITNPRDFKGFVKTLGKEDFSFMTGVNTLFNALMETPGFSALDFSHFKVTLGGGMAVQQVVADRWKKVTGVTLSEAYGLTETSPAVCINPLNIDHYTGMIGLPIPSTEVEIRDAEKNPLPIGERGELWVRGPQVMKGYWQRPEETAEVMDANGWLRTGDVAILNEEGYVKIVDRLKDMINVSGFNVFSNEIEGVIAAHEKVLEVGVVGVPDEHSGEAVKAFVVKKDDSLTEEELKRYCHEQLTGYKCPRVVVFLRELPKTNIGKVLRRALREM
jgi:long-chain acyl-CoA synthetase